MESMSGGVMVFDYDRDGWPDIYFTNPSTVEMAINGQKTTAACCITTITMERSQTARKKLD